MGQTARWASWGRCSYMQLQRRDGDNEAAAPRLHRHENDFDVKGWSEVKIAASSHAAKIGLSGVTWGETSLCG